MVVLMELVYNKMMNLNKKGGIMLWVILIIVILAIIGAIAIYSLVTGSDVGSFFGGGNIPTPPPLPE